MSIPVHGASAVRLHTCCVLSDRIVRVQDRPILSVEKMGMMGKCMQKLDKSGLNDEDLADLSGNAFNGFVLIPLLLSILCHVPEAWDVGEE